MEENTYQVMIDDVIIAQEMPLNYANILIEALFERYYNDAKMKVSIKRTEEKGGLE